MCSPQPGPLFNHSTPVMTWSVLRLANNGPGRDTPQISIHLLRSRLLHSRLDAILQDTKLTAGKVERSNKANKCKHPIQSTQMKKWKSPKVCLHSNFFSRRVRRETFSFCFEREGADNKNKAITALELRAPVSKEAN